MQQTQSRDSYPPLYHRMAAIFRRGGIVTVAVGLAGVFLCVYLFIAWQAMFLLLSFFGVFAGVIAWCGWVGGTTPLAVRCVPYFANRTGTTETFCHGTSLARNAGAVDDLARVLGMIPLTDFGITAIEPTKNNPFPCSDYRVDIWFATADALPTLAVLVAALRENRFLLGATETPLVLADLERITARLRQADADGVPFRFLLCYSAAASGDYLAFEHGYF